MKQKTDAEIVAKCMELWPEAEPHAWGSDEPAVAVKRKEDGIHIIVACMYPPWHWGQKSIELTFDKRLALSEFFDTMNVELIEEINVGGCETCDYGGSHGFEAVVREGAVYDPAVAAAAKSIAD